MKRRKGSTRQGRKVRARVMADNLATTGGRCTLAIPGICTVRATQAHHTLGYYVTGDDARYMQATCAECNNKVGDPRRAAAKPQPKRLTSW